jgi:hypothetical protein
VPEAGRLREQVENHGRACTHVLFLWKANLGFFHFLETVTGCLVLSLGQKDPNAAWLVPSTTEDRSRTLKTGFFMQVRQLKIIQMKNPGNALHSRQGPEGKGVTRIMRSYKTEPRVALVLVNAVSQAYNGM